MLNNTYYLHFVTDLRRAVFCLNNKNLEGTQTFLDHAHSIYLQQLKTDDISKRLEIDFENIWNNSYLTAIPVDAVAQQKLADKLLTLSNIVFQRIMNQTEIISLKKLDGSSELAKTILNNQGKVVKEETEIIPHEEMKVAAK